MDFSILLLIVPKGQEVKRQLIIGSDWQLASFEVPGSWGGVFEFGCMETARGSMGCCIRNMNDDDEIVH